MDGRTEGIEDEKKKMEIRSFETRNSNSIMPEGKTINHVRAREPSSYGMELPGFAPLLEPGDIW
jgi:hypothetical protein